MTEPHEIARGCCAARRGHSTDIDGADFTFVAEDSHHDWNGRPTMTRVFECFTVTDDERDHDTFRTGPLLPGHKLKRGDRSRQ